MSYVVGEYTYIHLHIALFDVHDRNRRRPRYRLGTGRTTSTPPLKIMDSLFRLVASKPQRMPNGIPPVY
jgi:hypothetical protein